MNTRAILFLLAAAGVSLLTQAGPPAGITDGSRTHAGSRDSKILQKPSPACDWSLLAAGKNRFFVLCYHDFPAAVEDDRYAVATPNLVRQIEFLRHQGFSFVSVDDILAARGGAKPLPPKAVLFTVDDAYETFYTQTFPILKAYRIPCVLAVVDEWIEHAPEDPEYDKPFLTWEQIRELSASGLVEIASHTHNLHRDIQTGLHSTAPAAVSRAFDPAAAARETGDAYRRRIQSDLQASSSALQAKTGKAPRALVWPYGLYNQDAADAAKAAGFQLLFTLEDGLGSADAPDRIPRHMVTDNPAIEGFAREFRAGFPNYQPLRVIHADLDPLYAADPAEMARNVDLFVERIWKLKPTTVYLQAFADPDGDGNVSETYFPNSVLPVRADLFGRVSRALSIRGIQVYAWMPMLSFQLPGKGADDPLLVREFRKDQAQPQPSSSWYRRLSPFSPEARKTIITLFDDLACNCPVEGVLFQDDAYLTDDEDFHPDALPEYLRITGGKLVHFGELPEAQRDAWTDAKTKRLTSLALEIRDTVRRHLPNARFARTLYAPVVLNPAAEEWFAQSYADTLANFDFAVVMAYPYMEEAVFTTAWLRTLTAAAAKQPGAMQKTVFKIQAFDWKAQRPVAAATLNRQLRALLAAGALHVGYYPDNLFDDEPRLTVIRQSIGSRDIPVDPRQPEPKKRKPAEKTGTGADEKPLPAGSTPSAPAADGTAGTDAPEQTGKAGERHE